MRLLYLAPRGGDILALHLVDEFDYVAMVGDVVPEPFPESMVFHRWRKNHRLYDLIAAHRPDAVLLLLPWQEKPWLSDLLEEIGKAGLPFLMIGVAGGEVPPDSGPVISLQCLPSRTGDDPLSVSLATGKVLLPESVAERELGCPDLREVTSRVRSFFDDGRLPDLPDVTLKSLKDYLEEESVEVKVVSDKWPPRLVGLMAKLSGAVYWPPSVWERYFKQVGRL